MRLTILLVRIFVIIMCLVALSYFVYPDFYQASIKEDGFFENMTALIMLFMAILLSVKFFRKKDRNWRWSLFHIGLILACFFGFGEEISWGQRLLGLNTNDFFSQYNVQNETNLHNLEFNGIKLNKVLFSVGLIIMGSIYFLIFPILYRKWIRFQRFIDTYGVPIPNHPEIILLLVSTLIILTIPDGKVWELWEGIFVSIFFLVLLNPYNPEERLLSSK